MNEKSITTITLKKINKKSVYQYIYEHRQTAKQQIVQDLTMGLSTVSQNLNVLEKEGLISRDGFFESTGGRKAQVIQIVPEYRIAVGVGILKNMFHLAAVNLYGEAIAEETVAVPFAQSDAYYDGIASSLESFLDRNGYDREKILGVSIATQGIPAPDGESVLYGEILHNTDMKLADFSTRIPYPCRLEHDSKAAASLELWNHPEIESAVVFLLNRNLGGAVITNHKVHQGLSMHSGTLEHICIDPEGPECYCGQKGCLETYCSANALEAAAQMPVKEFLPALHMDIPWPKISCLALYQPPELRHKILPRFSDNQGRTVAGGNSGSDQLRNEQQTGSARPYQECSFLGALACAGADHEPCRYRASAGTARRAVPTASGGSH